MKKLVGVVLMWLVSLSIHAQTIDNLSFITEEYPPFNFEKDGKRQGISVDTLVEMLSLVGSRKTRDDIKLWPWARGYETALKEKNTVLFATVRTNAREHLFKWVGPIMPSRIVLVAPKSRNIIIGSIEDLNRSQYKIGVVREDVAEQLLLKLGVKPDRIFRATSGMNVAKMLQAGHIDMWAYGSPVILWNMKELGYATSDYEEVYTLSNSESYYYAFHKNVDDKIIAQFQQALDYLKKSGKFDEIMVRYR
ncbi:MAG TPA: ABC transporter substrate-binding protein [Burkholderiaceae bacterium]|nr:ABC transporter substrate-binding protein [Burkholderiaceae bacterium]